MFHGLEIYKRALGRKFEVYFCSDNILVFKVNDNVDIELADMKEMLALAKDMLENEKNKNLIISGKYSTLTADAQKFMQTEEGNINKPSAEAIVVNSLAQRIIGNFYLDIISTRRPSKLFTSIDLAIQWLKSKN
jgi:hypothetical protein